MITEAPEFEITEADLIQWAKDDHERHPAKFAKCPECNLFSAFPSYQEFHTQDGFSFRTGGVCKTHGAWTDS